ncbi:MAG TPA: 4-vinyl reductase [Gemmatimonadales bacterium]|nr:4-vinyl reductase [Gemmatimonadales bacterium]
MTIPSTSSATGLTIGTGGLLQLHRSLLQYAPDAAISVLQESGYAAGEGVYAALCSWLGTHAGTENPAELDATLFAGALSDFFLAAGWGRFTIAPVGGAALALDSSDWIEAEPGTAQMPMCFFSSGMLADLMGRVSGEQVAVMEVECRSKGDSICRFLSGSPETLQEVYQKMAAGMSYVEALGGG